MVELREVPPPGEYVRTYSEMLARSFDSAGGVVWYEDRDGEFRALFVPRWVQELYLAMAVGFPTDAFFFHYRPALEAALRVFLEDEGERHAAATLAGLGGSEALRQWAVALAAA